MSQPKIIDGAIDSARMQSHHVPPDFGLDQLRSDQVPLIINGKIQVMKEGLDRLLPIYCVTTIGRRQPQAPTH